MQESWSWLSLISWGKKTINEQNEEEQKEQIKRPCLPNNGKHSVLIVTKESYEKLLELDEAYRKQSLMISQRKQNVTSLPNHKKTSYELNKNWGDTADDFNFNDCD